MKICHLGKYYPPAFGGMETHVEALARGQSRLGADVTVMCVNHLSDHGEDLRDRRRGVSTTVRGEADGVSVVRVGRWGGLSKFELCPDLVRLPSLLTDFDVVHLHAPNPTFSLPLLAARFTAPLFVTHHSDVVKQRVLAKLFHPVERRIYTRATRILATSPWYSSGSALLRLFDYKLDVLPLGVDIESFSRPSPVAMEYAARFRAQFPGPLWLCVGRLVYYKGLHTAIEALKRTPGTLVVVGRGYLETVLKRMAREARVEERVHWIPQASPDELRGLYLAATALWFPSNTRSEGFGLVQVEAMAAGCPIVNTSVPASGVAWVAPHEVAAITVAPESPVQLAQASARLLNDERLRRKLIINGRRRAARLFSESSMAAASLTIYRAASPTNIPSVVEPTDGPARASRTAVGRRELAAAN